MTGEQILVGVGLGTLAIYGTMLAMFAHYPVRPGVPVVAEVVYIAPTQGRFSLSNAVVIRDTTGRSGEAFVAISELTCRVGDRVRAEEVGAALILEQGECVRLATNAWAQGRTIIR